MRILLWPEGRIGQKSHTRLFYLDVGSHTPTGLPELTFETDTIAGRIDVVRV